MAELQSTVTGSLSEISVMGGGSEGPYPTITSNLAAAKIEPSRRESTLHGGGDNEKLH